MNIPDDRYRWLVDLFKPKSAVPAFLEVVDIAGLVKCVCKLLSMPHFEALHDHDSLA